MIKLLLEVALFHCMGSFDARDGSLMCLFERIKFRPESVPLLVRVIERSIDLGDSDGLPYMESKRSNKDASQDSYCYFHNSDSVH